jgi:hypothetical protein
MLHETRRIPRTCQYNNHHNNDTYYHHKHNDSYYHNHHNNDDTYNHDNNYSSRNFLYQNRGCVPRWRKPSEQRRFEILLQP